PRARLPPGAVRPPLRATGRLREGPAAPRAGPCGPREGARAEPSGRGLASDPALDRPSREWRQRGGPPDDRARPHDPGAGPRAEPSPAGRDAPESGAPPSGAAELR